MNLKRILNSIVEVFFPAMCEGCGKVGSYLCEQCAGEHLVEREQRCHVCKEELTASSTQLSASSLVHKKCLERTNLNGVVVVFEYNKFLEDYIGDIKYEYYFAMVDDLVNTMSRKLNKCSIFTQIVKKSVLCPVPLNPWRRRSRGFNQAKLFSVKLSKRFGAKSVKLLKRIKNTKKQVGLKRRERLENVKGVFRIRKRDVSNIKKVVLVDDVMTTGATLEECAKELKRNGVEEVYGLVVGRG